MFKFRFMFKYTLARRWDATATAFNLSYCGR
jgi:hypothetical protein